MVHLLRPLAVSLLLFAQKTPPPAPAKPPAAAARPAPPPPPQRFDFEEDPIEGELQRPDEELVHGRARQPRHSSLIEIPRTMLPALVKSFEDL